MGTFLYFGYGSNLLLERLKARCPSAARAGLATVPGKALGFFKKSIDGSGKGMLRASATPEDDVIGALFELNDDEAELKRLHDAEGRGSGYDYVEEFSVMRFPEGSTEIVRAYEIAPTHLNESLLPYDWYLALVVAGAIQSGLPEAYVERLRATPCKSDPRADRASRVEALAVLASAGHDSIESVLTAAKKSD